MKVSGVTTTEVCNISCTMCHFNAPRAIRKSGTLTPDQVQKFIAESPPGQELWFAGTGELYMDPHALDHLRAAYEAGHKPCVLTNGQLLTPDVIDKTLNAGVRFIRISVDAIDADHYRKVRQGGELSVILDACAYLKAQKQTYPDLKVEVNNTLFLNTMNKQDEFIEFWRDKVDGVNFNAEYYDMLKFRNKFFEPEQRNECEVSVYLLPTGQMAPCCAMMVYQHYNNVDWLPHIDTTTPEEAYDYFVQAYNDPSSDLQQVCNKCDWWIMWAQGEDGNTAYCRSVQFTEPEPAIDPAQVEQNQIEALQQALAQAQITIQTLEGSKAQLQAEVEHLHPLQHELATAQATIQRLESNQITLQADLQQTQATLDRCRAKQAEVRLKLEEAKAELGRSQGRIVAMESSKFWKLRQNWFRVRQAFGLKE